jgi:preprotein translocase subunit YajC
VTGGGIVGKVVRVMDGEVEIDAGNNVKFRVLKGTLSDVRDRAVPAAANDLKG